MPNPLISELASGTPLNNLTIPQRTKGEYSSELAIEHQTPRIRANGLTSMVRNASYTETKKLLIEDNPHIETLKVVLADLADNDDATSRIRYILGKELSAEVDAYPMPADLNRKGPIPGRGMPAQEPTEAEAAAASEASRAARQVPEAEKLARHLEQISTMTANEIGSYISRHMIGGDDIRYIVGELEQTNSGRVEDIKIALSPNVFASIMAKGEAVEA